MPTLDHVFAVEEWRNGRKWADCGSSAFLHHEAETGIAEAMYLPLASFKGPYRFSVLVAWKI